MNEALCGEKEAKSRVCRSFSGIDRNSYPLRGDYFFHEPVTKIQAEEKVTKSRKIRDMGFTSLTYWINPAVRARFIF
jgi:hypothetical protein